MNTEPSELAFLPTMIEVQACAAGGSAAPLSSSTRSARAGMWAAGGKLFTLKSVECPLWCRGSAKAGIKLYSAL